MYKTRCSILALLVTVLLCFGGTPALAADKRLEGIVDVEKLAQSLDLKTFSDQKKNSATERQAREKLMEAGWIPNDKGVFTIRLCSSELSYLTNPEERSVYIMPLTRVILPIKRPLPSITDYYVVTYEALFMNNFSAKMKGFGYIGRGSHTKGSRYGILPFNKGFVRLLGSSGEVTTYIFTLNDVDTKRAKEDRLLYELYLKCRFSKGTHDYIRRQANVKTSSTESPNSRRIMEYMVCVDVVGAFLYNSKTGVVIREWRID